MRVRAPALHWEIRSWEKRHIAELKRSRIGEKESSRTASIYQRSSQELLLNRIAHAEASIAPFDTIFQRSRHLRTPVQESDFKASESE